MKEAITAAAAAACGRSEAATAAAPPSQAPSQAASSLGGPVQSCFRTPVLVVVLASEPARWEATRRRSLRLARAHRLRGVAASAAAPNSAMGVWLEPNSQPFPFRRAQSAKALYKSNRVAATTREACGRAVPRRRLHRAPLSSPPLPPPPPPPLPPPPPPSPPPPHTATAARSCSAGADLLPAAVAAR